MNRSRPVLILSLLLALSVAFNIWQLLFPLPVSEGERTGRLSRTVFQSPPGNNGGSFDSRPGQVSPAVTLERNGSSEGRQKDPGRMTDEELLFGSGEVWMARETQLAVPVSSSGGGGTPQVNSGTGEEDRKYRIKAAVRVSNDRVVALGTIDILPGQRIKFERQREFSFFGVRDTGSSADGRSPFEVSEDFPVTPVVPVTFDKRDCGLGVELRISPVSGQVLFEGVLKHYTAESFRDMPGKDFNELNLGASGQGALIGNQPAMLPQFTAAELPFSGMAAEGAICRIPVTMTFGPATLELTGDRIE